MKSITYMGVQRLSTTISVCSYDRDIIIRLPGVCLGRL